MNLRYITCSDPREFNDIHDIVNLAQLSPRTEIAVQAHPSKMSVGMPRNQWFHELLNYVMTDKYNVNLAVHVNREWCEQICETGTFPQELKEMFDLCHDDKTGCPVIKRWQLNMSRSAVKSIKYNKLKRLFQTNKDREFILQYNENTRLACGKLYDMGARFSLLYDASGGRGISPTVWTMPVFADRAQGYSGGMSPENVSENLQKISTVAVKAVTKYDERNRRIYSLKERDDIWIDAEGKLKLDDKFNIERARNYIINAENWLNRHR